MRNVIFVGDGRYTDKVPVEGRGLVQSSGLAAAIRYASAKRGFGCKFARSFDEAVRHFKGVINGEGEHGFAFFSRHPYDPVAVVAAARYPRARVMVFFREPPPANYEGDIAIYSGCKRLPPPSGKPQCFPVEELDEVMMYYAAPFHPT